MAQLFLLRCLHLYIKSSTSSLFPCAYFQLDYVFLYRISKLSSHWLLFAVNPTGNGFWCHITVLIGCKQSLTGLETQELKHKEMANQRKCSCRLSATLENICHPLQGRSHNRHWRGYAPPQYFKNGQILPLQ